MARTKRTSTVLETARQRLAGLKSISPAPDFGATLTVATYEADINALSAKLDAYNEQLATLDSSQRPADTTALRLTRQGTFRNSSPRETQGGCGKQKPRRQ